MEYALCLPRRESLAKLKKPWEETVLGGDLSKVLGKVEFTRFYFGQEFCERLLPTLADIEAALEEGKGMEITLVTPYVTEQGLRNLKPLLRELAKVKPGCEVVVNDWGVLYLIHREYPDLQPVIGRLLNKSLKDVRIFDHVKSEGELERFRSSTAASPYVQSIFKGFNIERVETDHLPQGLSESPPNYGFRTSLYTPYGCITTGRICLMGSWGMPQNAKFRTTAPGCSGRCRSHWLELKDISNQIQNNRDWRILQKGNTLFYLQLGDFLVKGFNSAAGYGIDRIVVQPEPI